jgi:hypothetical protein
VEHPSPYDVPPSSPFSSPYPGPIPAQIPIPSAPSSALQPCALCCSAAQPEPAPLPSGAHCSILYFDIAAFGDPSRDNDIQAFVRRGLYRILRKAMNRTGIPWDRCYREDRGDGVLAVVPPEIPTVRLLRLPAWLRAEIHRHNKCSSQAAGIRLRAALHAGAVHRDAYGLSGRALVHAARLIEAQPAKDALARPGAELVFILSEPVYESVLAQSAHLPEAAAYRPFETRVKESSLRAWMTVAGAARDRLEGQGQAALPEIR